MIDGLCPSFEPMAPVTMSADNSTEARAPDVLLVVSDLGQGGTQTMVCRLTNAWAQSGRRVRLLIMLKREDSALSLDPAVDQVALPSQELSWAPRPLRSLWRIVRWICAIRKEIISTRPPLVLSFITSVNVQVLIACLGLRGLRVVVCERSDPTRQRTGRHWSLLAKLLYRTADLVTANSRGAVSVLAESLPKRKVAFVPNLLPRRDDDLAVETDFPLIVITGRLVPLKGHDLLFEAFAKLRAELPNWRIAILGDGPGRQNLVDLAERLGIAQFIDWHGHVADPYPYYRAAKICVMPSRYEGMPNALLEAMSCALPAIISDASPGPLELISHERNGLVFRSDDSDALAGALSRLAKDSALRLRLGAAAKERAADYDQDQTILEWNRTVGLTILGEQA